MSNDLIFTKRLRQKVQIVTKKQGEKEEKTRERVLRVKNDIPIKTDTSIE